MLFADSHCDTAIYVHDKGESLYDSSGAVSFKKGLEIGNWLQFYAAFVHARACRGREIQRGVELLDKVINECTAHSDKAALCLCHADVMKAFSQKKTAAILSIEGGEALGGSLAMLRMYHRIGVRAIGLTWNYRNELTDGVMDNESCGGLTQFGRDVVAEMNSLGMIVDISHVCEKGVWDVLECSTAPIMASHSNAKAQCDHPRNLTDDQIKAIIKGGGYIGINCLSYFLTPDGNATSDDVLRHVDHIVSLGGERCVGLGCDFDGTNDLPKDIHGIQDIPQLIEKMRQRGYSESFIKGFAGENLLSLIKRVVG